MSNPEASGGLGAARDWLPALDRYRTPSQLRSLLEIAITAVPFAVLWLSMRASLEWSYPLSLAIAVPAAGFLVRLFMIQHDCGHGSFFRRRWANDWTGRAISVLTFNPTIIGAAAMPCITPAREISTGAASATSRP